MNRIFWVVLGLLSTAALGQTPTFSKGTWVLSTAGCTRPGYVPSPDEQAFLDALHQGLTVDAFIFEDAQRAAYYQRITFPDFGVTCEGMGAVSISYPQDGVALLNYGAMKWKQSSTKPNTTITCEDSGPRVERVNYRWNGKKFHFISPQDADCGEFHLVWAPK